MGRLLTAVVPLSTVLSLANTPDKPKNIEIMNVLKNKNEDIRSPYVSFSGIVSRSASQGVASLSLGAR